MHRFLIKSLFMGTLIPLFTKRTFEQTDLDTILPVVRRITQQSSERVGHLQKQLEWVPKQEPLFAELTHEIEEILDTWATKVEKLGANAIGVWEVDFKADNGRYAWQCDGQEESCCFYESTPLYTLVPDLEEFK